MLKRIAAMAFSIVGLMTFATHGDSPRMLSACEMKSIRGGSAFQAKCSQSCNAYNSLNDDCVGGTTTVCFSCENATTTIYYIDMPSMSCGDGGYEQAKTSTDCGAKLIGTCKNYQCQSLQPFGKDCLDPTDVQAQGSTGK